MSPRRVFGLELGRFFLRLREARGLGLRQAATVAGSLGLESVTKQSLLQLEKGRTKNPDPDLLRQLAKLYETDYTVLVCAVVRSRYEVTVTVRVATSEHGEGGKSFPYLQIDVAKVAAGGYKDRAFGNLLPADIPGVRDEGAPPILSRVPHGDFGAPDLPGPGGTVQPTPAQLISEGAAMRQQGAALVDAGERLIALAKSQVRGSVARAGVEQPRRRGGDRGSHHRSTRDRKGS